MNTTTQLYIEELQTDPQVLGIILFGSWARGNNRPDSDVDLLVIVKDGFKRTVEYRAGQAFELTYTTEHGAIEYWQSSPDDAVELWRIAKVLFDRDGTVARLRQAGNEIKEGEKKPLSTDQYNHYKFDVQDQLKAIEKLADTDQTTARMLLSSKIFQLTELFFDVRQLWTPPPKQRLAIIKQINHNLHDLIAEYYHEQSMLEQINTVKSITTIVFDK
jgi:predicted nucleotidyltransferase